LRTISTTTRMVELADLTFNGRTGFAFIRNGDGGTLWLGTSVAALISSGNAHIEVGQDGTGNFVKSIDIYNRRYTSTTQMVRVTNNGALGISTSSRRYKVYEKVIDIDYAKRILGLNAVSWYDKTQAEAHADYLTKLSNGEKVSIDDKAEENIRRIGGVIAEDVHGVGLEMYVNYDDKNRPDGISQYLWTLLIPITKEHEQILKTYDNRFGTLENRIDKMEKEIELLKGA